MTKAIAIGSDDAGFHLKEKLKKHLESEGHAVEDYGCDSPDPVDYPDVALTVAKAVARGDHDRAILVCGTGIGMAIAANKVPGVYATVAHDPYSAAKARTSNNTQVLALGGRVSAPGYKKLINDPFEAVDEALEGFVAAHAELVSLAEPRVVVRRQPAEDKVGLVIGGGSGHEPAFVGYVGRGIADAAACGNVF